MPRRLEKSQDFSGFLKKGVEMDECEGTEAYGTANGVEGEGSSVPEQRADCPGVVPGTGDRGQNVLY